MELILLVSHQNDQCKAVMGTREPRVAAACQGEHRVRLLRGGQAGRRGPQQSRRAEGSGGGIPRRVETKTEHIREISFFMILTRFFGPDLDRLMEGREPAAGVISELRGGLVPL